MIVKFRSLSKEMQKEVKSIMNGNGLKVSEAIIHKDGENIVLEVKKVDKFIKVNF